MDTSELITNVRHGLLEYQINPISDSLILVHLNNAYRRLYNHFARASDNHFGQIYSLSITAGTQEYTLPERMWSKRIDYIAWPTPGNDARAYVPIAKIDYKDSHIYDLPAAYSLIPNAWAQLNNTLYFYPKPSTAVTARVLYIPALAPLKLAETSVLSFSSPTITTTSSLSSTFTGYVGSTSGEDFLSICDGNTGVIKHVMRYSAASGTSITLADPSLRSQYKGVDFSTTSSTLTDIEQDDVIVHGYGTGVPLGGDAFDEFLSSYAILSIKSALNENDTQIKANMDELIQAFKTDRVGRPGIESIQRLDRGIDMLGLFRRPR